MRTAIGNISQTKKTPTTTKSSTTAPNENSQYPKKQMKKQKKIGKNKGKIFYKVHLLKQYGFCSKWWWGQADAKSIFNFDINNGVFFLLFSSLLLSSYWCFFGFCSMKMLHENFHLKIAISDPFRFNFSRERFKWSSFITSIQE